MQQVPVVHGLPIHTPSSLAFLPLGSSAVGDTIHISQIGSSYMPSVQQSHLSGLGGPIQQVQVCKDSIIGQGSFACCCFAVLPVTSFQTSMLLSQVLVPPFQPLSSAGAPSIPSVGAQFVQAGPLLQPPREQRTIFFAGCTPIVSSETIHALFSQFGRVEDINLFRPYSGSKTSKVSVAYTSAVYLGTWYRHLHLFTMKATDPACRRL